MLNLVSINTAGLPTSIGSHEHSTASGVAIPCRDSPNHKIEHTCHIFMELSRAQLSEVEAVAGGEDLPEVQEFSFWCCI